MLWQKGRGRLLDSWSGKIRFLNCTLESIPCVNDTVIYGMMYRVRKQMGGGLHKVCYDGAGCDAG